MVLNPFFQQTNIKLNKELHFDMLNITTMITLSNLHKLHLTQGDDGHWVKDTFTPIPP